MQRKEGPALTGTMTWVGLDVHARSTHAAIDRESGVLTRARFGAGAEPVVAWLQRLPQPIHACYEAGPTGYALYRAAEAVGLRVDVVAQPDGLRSTVERVAGWARFVTGVDRLWQPLEPRHHRPGAGTEASASQHAALTIDRGVGRTGVDVKPHPCHRSGQGRTLLSLHGVSRSRSPARQ